MTNPLPRSTAARRTTGLLLAAALAAPLAAAEPVALREFRSSGHDADVDLQPEGADGFRVLFDRDSDGRHDAGASAELGKPVELGVGETLAMTLVLDLTAAGADLPASRSALRLGFERGLLNDAAQHQTVVFSFDTGPLGSDAPLFVSSGNTRNEFSLGHGERVADDADALAADDALAAGHAVPVRVSVTRGEADYTAGWAWGGWSGELAFTPKDGNTAGAFDRVFVITNTPDPGEGHGFTVRDAVVEVLAAGEPLPEPAAAAPPAEPG